MKKIIISIFLFFAIVVVVQSQTQYEWTNYTFKPGDTTTTFSVFGAHSVYFMFTDSSATGTDSLAIYLEGTTNNKGQIQYATIVLYALSQTTTTTRVSSSLIIPGDNTTVCYLWTVPLSNDAFTGTFKISRLNGAVVPYAQKTQCCFKFD